MCVRVSVIAGKNIRACVVGGGCLLMLSDSEIDVKKNAEVPRICMDSPRSDN